MDAASQRRETPRVSFITFYVMWADVMQWAVPPLHVRVCLWLEQLWTSGALRGVLMLPRGHAKSTIVGVFNAWLYYCWPTLRMLHQGESDPTAYKTSRDTKAILRRHPLTARGIGASLRGEMSFWWTAANRDERNPSMQAAGVMSNTTSSRADIIENDDVEVQKNVRSAEGRESLRGRLGEQTHIAVPGALKLYVGTPHTHDSLYDETIALGAEAMIVPMFDREMRIERAEQKRYALTFVPEYVFSGIGESARVLQAGLDYWMEGKTIVFPEPSGALVDCYAGAAWPERFTPEVMEERRRECRTINEWDSQYQLHAKPVTQVRLDPDRITPYDCEVVMRRANNDAVMLLGDARIVSAALRWDPSSGKVHSDVSAVALVLQDEQGRRYIHRVIALTGEVAEFDDSGKRIVGGQVFQLCDLIAEIPVPRVVLENNGVGTFAPSVLKAALKQRRLLCGVTEEATTGNKNRRILESLEPLLLSPGMLWAHVEVLDGPLFEQMRDWNPAIQQQPDDYLDAVAAACAEVPERAGKSVGNPTPRPMKDWRPSAGTFDVQVDI